MGHSSPYEEPQSYALAVKYLFLSGPALPSFPSTQSPSPPGPAQAHIIPPLRIEPFSARDTRNEFELPWIMRALVDSPQVKDLFPGELRELKEGVGAWRPVTKVLKEVKRRVSLVSPIIRDTESRLQRPEGKWDSAVTRIQWDLVLTGHI